MVRKSERERTAKERICHVHDPDDPVPGRICGRYLPCKDHDPKYHGGKYQAPATLDAPDAPDDTPLLAKCIACGEPRRVLSTGWLEAIGCPATFTEESAGIPTELCRAKGEPFPKCLSLFGPSPRPKPIANVFLYHQGKRIHWRMTRTARAWWTTCPHCGGSVYTNVEAVRPGAVQCGRCRGWVPAP
jgi:hypothetical protein